MTPSKAGSSSHGAQEGFSKLVLAEAGIISELYHMSGSSISQLPTMTSPTQHTA